VRQERLVLLDRRERLVPRVRKVILVLLALQAPRDHRVFKGLRDLKELRAHPA
jgi:hypothetical protein